MKTFKIIPIPKPRMVRSDSWRKRPCVMRYWKFKDEINKQKGDFVFPESNARVYFVMPMPKSWSKKKMDKLDDTPHLQRPDTDNLLKAFWDSLLVEDCRIWDCRMTKCWGREGEIIVVSDIDQ